MNRPRAVLLAVMVAAAALVVWSIVLDLVPFLRGYIAPNW